MALSLFRRRSASQDHGMDVSRVLSTPSVAPSVVSSEEARSRQGGQFAHGMEASAAEFEKALAARLEKAEGDASWGEAPLTTAESGAPAPAVEGSSETTAEKAAPANDGADAPATSTAAADGQKMDADTDAVADEANGEPSSASETLGDADEFGHKAEHAARTATATGLLGREAGHPEERSANDAPRQAAPRSDRARLIAEKLTPIGLWAAIGMFFASVVVAAVMGGIDLNVLALMAGGIFLFTSVIISAILTGAYSTVLLTGLLFRRAVHPKPKALSLAGRDVLSALGLAEGILDADADGRLVTTQDGVVVYANHRYMDLARTAGVIGVTGLPPRLDRLFSQSGLVSRQIFSLHKIARSGLNGEEIVTQAIGPKPADGGDNRRRFEVCVRPMGDDQKYVVWRLRELPLDDAHDRFRISYRDYPRPVFALDRAGTVEWFNKAACEFLNLGTDSDVPIADLLLGEATDVVDALTADSYEECEARVRVRKSEQGHAAVVFTPFTRIGTDGPVCVEMLPKQGLVQERAPQDLASDVTDAPIGVAVIEGELAEAKFTTVNRVFSEAFGAKSQARLSDALTPDNLRDLTAALKTKPQSKALTRAIDVTVGQGAEASNFHLFARPIKRRRGGYGTRQLVLYAVDVSFLKRMEEDYNHDKRLKEIGKIAGSVAHDFNNFLQAVMGITELLMRRHPAGDPSYADLVAIRENSQRARNLTRDLLAFSRKQTLRSDVLSVTDLLSDFTPFVQRYATEKVKVEVDHGRNVGSVKVDKRQLELAIMNLSVNARDAMPKGGTLTIRSRRVEAADVTSYGYAQLAEEPYVLIELEDTGTGVPNDLEDKIFDPFFTTKGEGKGTGLGLSTVHGIIGQMNGAIFLHNRPGEGATFRIFLPALSAEEEAAAKEQAKAAEGTAPPAPSDDDLTGKGRILIVEDEDAVRGIVVRALAMCGYDITEACDGEEALDMLDEIDEPFDIVLSDIMMPEMDGPTLIQEAGEKLKGAKVIFMSGYAETAMRDKLEMIDNASYLQKPFTLKTVAAAVKDAMAG